MRSLESPPGAARIPNLSKTIEGVICLSFRRSEEQAIGPLHHEAAAKHAISDGIRLSQTQDTDLNHPSHFGTLMIGSSRRQFFLPS